MAMKDPEPEYEPRRGDPGATYGYTNREGEQVELQADDEGVVWPKTAHDVEVLDSFDLPVARKALAEAKEDEQAKPAAKTGGRE